MPAIRPQLLVVVLVFVGLMTLQMMMYRRRMAIHDSSDSEPNCSKCPNKRNWMGGYDGSGSAGSSRVGSTVKDIPPPIQKAKAAIVILCRNSDLEGLNKTIPQFERRFNGRFAYPYVLLNDQPFDESFKTAVMQLTSDRASFGVIPKEHWSVPSWINQTRADESRKEMDRRGVIYGGSLPYRHMCRFNSGFFFRHPLLKDLDYYWRVEPWVDFYCDMPYDPFLYMKEHKKEYGFTIMLPEYIETIPTLWKTVRNFMEEHPTMVHSANALKMFEREDGNYNLCHFWSNFEIGSLNFLRSEAYLKFFEYLDNAGGFFYERWGDAPVHSIAAAMLLSKDQIHWFQDVGYYHGPFTNCPSNPVLQMNCDCDPNRSNEHRNACHDRWVDLYRK